MCVPRNLNESLMVMGSPDICMEVFGRGLCLKSIMSSCVLDVVGCEVVCVEGEEPG